MAAPLKKRPHHNNIGVDRANEKQNNEESHNNNDHVVSVGAIRGGTPKTEVTAIPDAKLLDPGCSDLAELLQSKQTAPAPVPPAVDHETNSFVAAALARTNQIAKRSFTTATANNKTNQEKAASVANKKPIRVVVARACGGDGKSGEQIAATKPRQVAEDHSNDTSAALSSSPARAGTQRASPLTTLTKSHEAPKKNDATHVEEVSVQSKKKTTTTINIPTATASISKDSSSDNNRKVALESLAVLIARSNNEEKQATGNEVKGGQLLSLSSPEIAVVRPQVSQTAFKTPNTATEKSPITLPISTIHPVDVDDKNCSDTTCAEAASLKKRLNSSPTKKRRPTAKLGSTLDALLRLHPPPKLASQPASSAPCRQEQEPTEGSTVDILRRLSSLSVQKPLYKISGKKSSMNELDALLCHEDFPELLALASQVKSFCVQGLVTSQQRQQGSASKAADGSIVEANEVAAAVTRMQEQLMSSHRLDQSTAMIRRTNHPLTDSLLDSSIAILQKELGYLKKATSAAELSEPNSSLTGDNSARASSSNNESIATKYPKWQTDVLMQWMIDNIENPFPGYDDVCKLMRQTNLTHSQIINWTTNVRKRNRKATCEHGKKPHHYIDFLFLAETRNLGRPDCTSVPHGVANITQKPSDGHQLWQSAGPQTLQPPPPPPPLTARHGVLKAQCSSGKETGSRLQQQQLSSNGYQRQQHGLNTAPRTYPQVPPPPPPSHPGAQVSSVQHSYHPSSALQAVFPVPLLTPGGVVTHATASIPATFRGTAKTSVPLSTDTMATRCSKNGGKWATSPDPVSQSQRRGENAAETPSKDQIVPLIAVPLTAAPSEQLTEVKMATRNFVSTVAQSYPTSLLGDSNSPPSLSTTNQPPAILSHMEIRHQKRDLSVEEAEDDVLDERPLSNSSHGPGKECGADTTEAVPTQVPYDATNEVENQADLNETIPVCELNPNSGRKSTNSSTRETTALMDISRNPRLRLRLSLKLNGAASQSREPTPQEGKQAEPRKLQYPKRSLPTIVEDEETNVDGLHATATFNVCSKSSGGNDGNTFANVAGLDHESTVDPPIGTIRSKTTAPGDSSCTPTRIFSSGCNYSATQVHEREAPVVDSNQQAKAVADKGPVRKQSELESAFTLITSATKKKKSYVECVENAVKCDETSFDFLHNWKAAVMASRKAKRARLREQIEETSGESLRALAAEPGRAVDQEEDLRIKSQSQITVSPSSSGSWLSVVPLLTPESFQIDLVNSFTVGLRKRSTEDGRKNAFTAQVKPLENSSQYQLEVTGDVKVTECFTSSFAQWLSAKKKRERFNDIRYDPMAVLIDIKFAPASWNDALVEEIISHGEVEGLWIDFSSNPEFWGKLVGNANVRNSAGAVLTAANGVACYTKKEFDETRNTNGGTVVTIQASRHTNIMEKSIDSSRVAIRLCTESDSHLMSTSTSDSASCCSRNSIAGSLQSSSSSISSITVASYPISSYKRTDNLSDPKEPIGGCVPSKLPYLANEQKEQGKSEQSEKADLLIFSHARSSGKRTLLEHQKRRTWQRPLVLPLHNELDGTDFDDTEVKVRKTRDNSHNPNQAKAKLSFEHFKTKMACVFDIEFQREGLRYQKVMAIMWKNHKNSRFGSHCDPQCKCACSLPLLTGDVVNEYISIRVRQEPEWHAPAHLRALDFGETPTGFSTNFCTKFVGALQGEYPQDAPIETLIKLCTMWTFHLAQSNFGMGAKCMQQCHCMDFEKDFLSKLEKKYRNNCFNRTEVTIGRSKESSLSVSSTIPRKEKHHLERNGNEVEKSGHIGNQSFPIDYDPRRPLGFHCITAVDKVGRPCCVISTISSTGMSRRNTILRTGFKVCAAEILAKEHHSTNIQLPIHNHRQLKLHYHTAKGRGAKLRVWFSTGTGEDKTNISPPQLLAQSGASNSRGDAWDGGEMLSKHESHTVSRVDIQVGSTVDQTPVSARPLQSLPRIKQEQTDTSNIGRKDKRVRFFAGNDNDAPQQYQMSTTNCYKDRETDEAPSMELSRKRQRISSSRANWVATAAAPTSQSVLQEQKRNYEVTSAQENANRLLILYLDAIRFHNKSNDFKCQFKVEERFKAQLVLDLHYMQHQEKIREQVREARTRATAEKLVIWGRQALRLPNKPVVPKGAPSEEFSVESFLRLSDSGITLLSVLPAAAAAVAVCKRDYSENANSSASLPSGAAVAMLGREDSPTGIDLRFFLECLTGKDSWVSMKDVVKRVGTSIDLFIKLRSQAFTSGHCIFGRKQTSGRVTVITPDAQMPLNPDDYLRLTPSGCSYLTTQTQQVTGDALLPKVSPAWFLTGGTCKHVHVQPCVGPVAANFRLEYSVLPSIRFHQGADSRGCSWYTACYRDVEKNMFYLSEGGPESRRNVDGVFWYPTKEEAAHAVSRVYAASQLHATQVAMLQTRSE